MADVETRTLQLGDEHLMDTLAHLHAKEFGHRSPDARKKEMLQHAQEANKTEQQEQKTNILSQTYVALKSGSLAGSCRVCQDDFDGLRPEYTPWLATLFVLPEFRGQKIGSRLVEHASKMAQLHGFEALYLWTPSKGLSEDMYKKLGWVTVEETKAPHGDSQEAIIMKKVF
eukprot:m.268711 g.268711  ORF g.268711 m.268711 type:complete len:171 (-) comp16256_c0_seq23:5688-6200(-)